MKQFIATATMLFPLLAGALLATTTSPTPTGRSSSAKPAMVMIVGVAHLVARRDVHNAIFADSPLSARRQTQIAAIVRRLARFQPTKVLVEVDVNDTKVRGQYVDYLRGRFALPADEVYQLGFRVAAGARNTAIYPIDTFGPPLLNENATVDDYLQSHFASVKNRRTETFLARQDLLERSGTYLDVLRYINSDAAIEDSASFYSVLDGMGRDADDAGAAYVSQWYARNSYIFSNILSVIEPGDRVVVLMGQGHEYLLREFVRLNPSLEYVDPLKYLDEAT